MFTLSNCCSSAIITPDVCSDCKEHCLPVVLCKCGNEASVTFINVKICRNCYDKVRGVAQ